MSEKRVAPYPNPVMKREKMALETYEYHMPFNYANITLNRRYLRGQEFHGVEINPVNSIGADKRHLPPDTIEIVESEPIVRVAVIGSACVPPGFVQLEAEPLSEFYREVDVPGAAAVRYRINNLWGMHLRADNWLAQCNDPIRDEQGRTYPEIPKARVEKVWGGNDAFQMKSNVRENPLAGMSSAIFEIPKSGKVILSGGSEICAWTDDNYPDDIHYSFRIIRVTVVCNDERGGK